MGIVWSNDTNASRESDDILIKLHTSDMDVRIVSYWSFITNILSSSYTGTNIKWKSLTSVQLD
jgi:hypothetical protein